MQSGVVMPMNLCHILLQCATVFYVVSMTGYLCYLVHQKDRIQQSSLVAMGVGAVLHMLCVVFHTIALGSLPIYTLTQSLSLAGLSMAVMFMYVQYRFRLKILGVFATAMISVLMLVAIFLPEAAATPDKMYKGIFFYGHIILIFSGEAMLALACGAGILYLIQEQGIKGKNPGYFFKRLPSLDFLDTVSYTCITTGFTLLTFGLVTGFIYARTVWGSFWRWDVKEVFSVGAWLVYAALLHLRLYSGWRGRNTAIMAVVGFLILVFTFLGVNFFLGGHHQVFTG